MSTPSNAPPFSPEYAKADRSGQLIAANVFVLVTSTVFLGLRLYVRRLTNSPRGWDEFLLPPAYLLLLGVIITTWLSIPQGGVGKHAVVVAYYTPEKLTESAKYIYAMEWFYVPSALLPRVSVIFLYLRVFTKRSARICCWLLLAFLISFSVATLIAAQLQCIPLHYIWNKHIQGHCFNQLLWYKLTNFPNVIADTSILLLPLPTISTLKASKSRRAGIFFVCFMGSLGLVASTVRTVQFFVRQEGVFGDQTWNSNRLLLWTTLESGMYFNAACLVGLRPLVRRILQFFKKYVTLHDQSKETTGNNNTGGETKSRSRQPTYVPRTRQFADAEDANSTTPVVSYGYDVDVTAADLYEAGPRLEREIPLSSHIRVDRKFEVSTASDC